MIYIYIFGKIIINIHKQVEKGVKNSFSKLLKYLNLDNAIKKKNININLKMILFLKILPCFKNIMNKNIKKYNQKNPFIYFYILPSSFLALFFFLLFLKYSIVYIVGGSNDPFLVYFSMSLSILFFILWLNFILAQTEYIKKPNKKKFLLRILIKSIMAQKYILICLFTLFFVISEICIKLKLFVELSINELIKYIGFDLITEIKYIYLIVIINLVILSIIVILGCIKKNINITQNLIGYNISISDLRKYWIFLITSAENYLLNKNPMVLMSILPVLISTPEGIYVLN